MSFALYSVPPFSGPRYHANSAKATGDETPCAICGKPVKPSKGAWPHDAGVCAETGEWALTEAEATQGAFPVGRDCHRNWAVLAWEMPIGNVWAIRFSTSTPDGKVGGQDGAYIEAPTRIEALRIFRDWLAGRVQNLPRPSILEVRGPEAARQ